MAGSPSPRRQLGEARPGLPARSGSAQASARISDRRLQPLRAVHGHHPDRVRGRGGIAHDLDLAAGEPVEKGLQRGGGIALELERRGEQFLDRIARLGAEPVEQLAAAVERAGQDRLEEAGAASRNRPCARIDCSPASRAGSGWLARRCGQSAPLRPKAAAIELVLGPAEQGRDEQAGEVEVVERLDGEAGGGEQILHGERRRQREPVDAGDRHVLACSRATIRQASSPRRRTRMRMSSGRSGRPRPSSQKGASSQRLICCASFVASSAPGPLTQPSSPLRPRRRLLRMRQPERDRAAARRDGCSRAGWRGAGRPSASWPRSAITRSTTARMGGEERKLRSIDRSRKSCSGRASLPAAARTRRGPRSKLARIGALEAEDRLLVVADREDGARAVPTPPRPAKYSTASARTMFHCRALVSCASSTRIWSVCWSSL